MVRRFYFKPYIDVHSTMNLSLLGRTGFLILISPFSCEYLQIQLIGYTWFAISNFINNLVCGLNRLADQFLRKKVPAAEPNTDCLSRNVLTPYKTYKERVGKGLG